ncbi:MAG: phosphotransferase family protein [Deltaproteobacteria bacterium]|nr:phosphotransferase family protein [Deltaproteobacteria bacterium]
MAFGDDERDLDETAAKLIEWLAPKLAVPPADIKIEDLDAPLGTGFSSDTLLFDLVYTKDGQEHREGLVARLEPEEYIVFPTYDLAFQVRIQQMLADTDVPVPHIRWFEPDKSVLGVPFYLMDRINGNVPSDNPPMHEEGWIADELSEAERASVWWNGFEAMCKVHRLDWKALGCDFMLEPERGETPLDQQLHYWRGYFEWGMPAERHPEIAQALDYLEANKPEENQVALCWGDSRLANQIFDGLEVGAVIDWEMARIGDPVQDLAWWLASDRCFSEGLELERLPGIPSPEETVTRWKEATGLDTSNLAYYTILALARFSMNMARIAQYMKKIEIIDEENEFDYENLASITLRRALSEL